MNIIIRSSSAHFHDTKIATYHLIRQSDDLKSSFVLFLFVWGGGGGGAGGIVCFVCVPGSHEIIHSSNTNFLVGNLEKIRHYIWVTFSRLKSYT